MPLPLAETTLLVALGGGWVGGRGAWLDVAPTLTVGPLRAVLDVGPAITRTDRGDLAASAFGTARIAWGVRSGAAFRVGAYGELDAVVVPIHTQQCDETSGCAFGLWVPLGGAGYSHLGAAGLSVRFTGPRSTADLNLGVQPILHGDVPLPFPHAALVVCSTRSGWTFNATMGGLRIGAALGWTFGPRVDAEPDVASPFGPAATSR
jgi:hypothetical protein